MEYYIGYIECKLHHNDRMEDIWIRRELGESLWFTLNQPWCTVVKKQRVPQALPADVYKRIDIYAEIEDSAWDSYFALAYPKLIKETVKTW